MSHTIPDHKRSKKKVHLFFFTLNTSISRKDLTEFIEASIQEIQTNI